MIGGQGEDSCGKSGTGENLPERMRRGGSAAAESEGLHGNQLLCHNRFSSCIPFVRL
ncbi:hypothetical protein [Priestia megaterium]|uniref:hypothetical protein n=1 Tax=Priestia megaterium TaxID=1404 RepID=UPI00399CD3F9